MELQGICHKMHADLANHSVTEQNTQKAHVEYSFILDQSQINLPFTLGQELEIEWTGKIFCVSCGAKTPKSYSQGHCFKCFKTKASCDMCIMKIPVVVIVVHILIVVFIRHQYCHHFPLHCKSCPRGVMPDSVVLASAFVVWLVVVVVARVVVDESTTVVGVVGEYV